MDNQSERDYNMKVAELDLVAHLHRQKNWSMATFGPGNNLQGLLAHIRKELIEVEAKPKDLKEWIDIAILSFDGAYRQGYSPEEIACALLYKQAENEGRKWPDWRTVPEGQPIEHIREEREEWP